jgi:hypothetical protein
VFFFILFYKKYSNTFCKPGKKENLEKKKPGKRKSGKKEIWKKRKSGKKENLEKCFFWKMLF